MFHPHPPPGSSKCNPGNRTVPLSSHIVHPISLQPRRLTLARPLPTYHHKPIPHVINHTVIRFICSLWNSNVHLGPSQTSLLLDHTSCRCHKPKLENYRNAQPRCSTHKNPPTLNPSSRRQNWQNEHYAPLVAGVSCEPTSLFCNNFGPGCPPIHLAVLQNLAKSLQWYRDKGSTHWRLQNSKSFTARLHKCRWYLIWLDPNGFPHLHVYVQYPLFLRVPNLICVL